MYLFFLNYARKTIKNLFICRKKCNFAANFAYFGMLSQDDDTSWRFLEYNN